MLSPEKINAMKKINEEFIQLNKNPLSNFGIIPQLFNEENIFEWKCSLVGPKDSYYKGGLFYFKVKFPDDYPNSRPTISFLTPIYHLNIKYYTIGSEPLGNVGLISLINWKSGDSIMKILPEVFVLLYKNNPYEAYDDVNQTRKNEFINNPELFEKKARYFTKKYANPCAIYKKNYPDGWDFTYKE